MIGNRFKIGLFYLVSALFLAANLYAVVARDSLLVSVLPVAAAAVLLALVRLDWLLLAVVFFTPLSIPLKELVPGLSFDMNLPTEPLMAGVLLLFAVRLAAGAPVGRNLLTHPVTKALGIYLGWMLLTCLTSTMPLVSLKYWLAKGWFIVAFYVFGYGLLAGRQNVVRVVLLYAAGLMPVIAYAWWRQSSYGFFDHQAANFVMNPFYKDHTSYGAMLAFFLPALLVLAFEKSRSFWVRACSGIIAAVFVVALVFSYTRAAWLSLAVAGGIFLLVRLKIRFRIFAGGAVAGLSLLLAMQGAIREQIEQNKQESSSELAGHLNSISNVRTDASNVERLNRWSCAVAMYREKPLTGWGPGTYMFQYAPFQRTDLRTIISTNSADAGNAHSEYLGPLAESGLPGLLSFLLLAGFIIRTGIRVWQKHGRTPDGRLAFAALLGLVSYLTHGLLNNFLDTDKAAVPFWIFTAWLVLLDSSAPTNEAEPKPLSID